MASDPYAEPIEDKDKKKRPKLDKKAIGQLKRLYAFIKPYNGLFALGMFFLLLSSLLTLTLPIGFQLLVNSIDPEAAEKLNRGENGTAEFITSLLNMELSTNNILFLILGILVIQAFVSFMRVVVFARVSQNSIADIRYAVFSKLVGLGVPFYDRHRVGEMHSRITADVGQLEGVFSFTFAEFLRQASTLIIGIPIIAFLAPKLTLFMLGTFPFLMLGAVFFGRFIRKLSRKTQDELANTNVIVEQALQTIQMVKAFTNELFEVRRYREGMNKVVRMGIKNAVWRGAFISFIIFGLMGGIVLVIWYGITLVADPNVDMDMGKLIAFIVFMAFIAGSLGGLPNTYSEILKALGASERLDSILQEAPELDPSGIDALEPIKLEGDIRYENVKFNYPTREDVEVLKGINIQVAPGQKVALAGPSGAGKSTIIQLLMRFYDPSSGNISIDGKKLDAYNISQLRHNIGIVPQEVILLGGTIRENIAYGRPGASDEEIRDAAKKANAIEFIESFPEGFETLVGDRGVKLSGGQRQRVAIARAILKDPAILILDEATSSLDAESEKLVQDALNVLMENRTTIVIAHRLATIRNVDRIYVLENGRIIESGTHDELSDNAEGMYSNLVKLQFEHR